MSRRPLPVRPRAELFSDDFRRGPSYTNWRPQGSGDCLLIYTYAGGGKIVTERGMRTTRVGDVLLYGPTEMQDYSTSPEARRWHLLWAHFTPRAHWQSWMNWPRNAEGLRLIHLEGALRRDFAAALRETMRLSRLQLAEATDLAFNALERAILWAHAADSERKWRAMDARVRRAVDYLVLHFREPFRMEALARHCGVSMSRLAHLFKAETQTSPQQFLEKHRIQQACQLLRITRRPIAEIAAEVGYEDPFYFTHRFRRHTRQSPREFRGKAER